MSHYSFLTFSSLATLFLIVSSGCGGEEENPSNQSGYATEVASLDGELQMHLDFSNSNITDEDLATLPLPNTIRSISLRGTKITDRGVAELKRAKNLERLDLQGTLITDAAVEEMTLMPRLWEATVGSTKVSPAAAKTLVKVLARHRSVAQYDTSRVQLSGSDRPPSGPQAP